jgi:predicted short-subunit dehydrogenase-like oxidoreductase (DUF2520 family)
VRQIPNYLIIGSGRLARHLAHYFQLCEIKFHNWSRSNHNISQLEEFLKLSEVIILAINDDSVKLFIQQYPILTTKTLIHCSGCLKFDNFIGIHPLMSFGNELYQHNTYKKISFIIDSSLEDFKKYFSTLRNPVHFIPKDEKAYYHALCVMSGNFTTIIWSKLFKELESRLNIPKEAAFTYLNSIALNLQINHRDALTGPLIRGDSKTINQNLAALENDSFLPIYQTFIKILGENYGHK